MARIRDDAWKALPRVRGRLLPQASGVRVAVAFAIYPHIGPSCIGKAFAVAMIGGIGNVAGARVGGLILGVVEVLDAQAFAAQIA